MLAKAIPLQRIYTPLRASHFFVHVKVRFFGMVASYMCTWNVRTLLDLDGPVESTKQNGEVSVMDERKIYKVVSKLDRYRVVVGCVAGDQVVWV